MKVIKEEQNVFVRMDGKTRIKSKKKLLSERNKVGNCQKQWSLISWKEAALKVELHVNHLHLTQTLYFGLIGFSFLKDGEYTFPAIFLSVILNNLYAYGSQFFLLDYWFSAHTIL